MKRIKIKFVNFNGTKHYFVYEEEKCVVNGTYDNNGENSLYYDLIHGIVDKYNYGRVQSISSPNKTNFNTVIYTIELK